MRLFQFDDALRRYHKVRWIVGVDEVGRGPLAGPVVAAAVVLPEEFYPQLAGIRDSKLLTPNRRAKLSRAIRSCALQIGVGSADVSEIDRHNILQATFLAMRRAVERLDLDVAPASNNWAGAGRKENDFRPEEVLVAVDGNHSIPGISFRQKPLIRGDAFSLSVASASIVAKVVRDRWMRLLEYRYPGYGFNSHKGYGTADHLKALHRLGPSPIHRRSFEPVAQAPLPLAI